MLTAIQWAAINHIVAYELSNPNSRRSHGEFAKDVGIDRKMLDRYQSFTFECAACKHHHVKKAPPTACLKCGGTEFTNTALFPEFIAALNDARKAARETGDYYAMRTRQWALEQMRQLYDEASTTSEKRQLLRQIREETADVEQKAPVDFSHCSDEDLEAMELGEKTLGETAFKTTILGGVQDWELKEL